jgi:hypothetical protein
VSDARETLERALGKGALWSPGYVSRPERDALADAIRAVLEENARLRAAKIVGPKDLMARIEAALAEIKTVRAVGDHYLEGILARLENALRGEKNSDA